MVYKSKYLILSSQSKFDIINNIMSNGDKVNINVVNFAVKSFSFVIVLSVKYTIKFQKCVVKIMVLLYSQMCQLQNSGHEFV